MTPAERAKRQRVLHALDNLADTGNALDDAFDQLLLDEDSYEFQLALMGKPVIAEVDGRTVHKTVGYYWRLWQDLYIDRAIAEIEAEERLHGDKSQ